MKKNIPVVIFLCIFLVFSNLDASATRWRVNNSGIPATFTSVQQAINSEMVSAGDTLYVEGSMFGYGDLQLTRRLVIFGPGYFLNENPETRANPEPAFLQNVTFAEGSQASVMCGMTVTGATWVRDTSIVLLRNNLSAVSIAFPSVSNYIRMNYIHSLEMQGSDWNLVENNIFTLNSPLSGGYCFYMDPTSSGTIRQNIFCGCQYISDCSYYNNIATGTAAEGNDYLYNHNSTVRNNIGASTQYGTSNNNQQNVDMSLVFTGTGSPDGKYQLLPGSPATGAGMNGEDSGIFGGNDPYVLSGIPDVPAVWQFRISGNEATVKVKSY